jgi:AcrR family transcriptional regulator
MPTQEQRRESTRAALLDATIESLVTRGYGATTTARVAVLAGLSRGAAPHYFASKADLVGEALSRLARRRIASIREAAPSDGADRAEGLETILDLIWEAHNGLIFAATIELSAAARSDPRLREALAAAEREVRHAIWEATADIAGARAREPGFREDMELVLAVARGLALLPLLGDGSTEAVERRWRAARARLMRVLT